MTFDADENYWIGVRDALRMVDSFIEWAKRNPDRAKPLEQFVNDALIAAAKRCKSCLSHALGVSFAASKEVEAERIAARPQVDFFEDTQKIVESSPLADTLRNPADLYSDESAHRPPSPLAPEIRESGPTDLSDSAGPSFEMSSDSSSVDESPIEIEGFAAEFHEVTPSAGTSPLGSLERKGTIREEDVSPTGTPRDFGDDFHLVEPDPLSVDTSKDQTESMSTDNLAQELSSTPIEDVEVEANKGTTIADEDLTHSDESFEDTIAEIDRVLDEAFSLVSEPETAFSKEPIEDSGSVWREPEEPPLTDDLASETSKPVMFEAETESVGNHEEPLITPPPEETEAGLSAANPLVTPPPVDSELEIDEPLVATAPFARGETDESISSFSTEATSEVSDDEDRPWLLSHEERDAWSPYDEPSVIHDKPLPEPEEPEKESEDETLLKDTSTPPPPPPPPPESDETEEELQKRTRRLFFGA